MCTDFSFAIVYNGPRVACRAGSPPCFSVHRDAETNIIINGQTAQTPACFMTRCYGTF